MASAAEKELAFAKAIEAVFNRWELLKLAVEHDFSGHGDSVDKAEWLYDCVLNYFKNNKDGDVLDLEDYLMQFFDEEFNCSADDGSARQIAELAVRLCQQAANGELAQLKEFTLAEMQRVKEPHAYYQDPAAQAAQAAALVSSMELQPTDAQPEQDGQSEQPESRPRAPKEPIVDEEGFTLVTRKKR